MRLLRPLLLWLALAGTAGAEPFVVDPSHAVVQFRVSHLGFSDVFGRFLAFDAEIDLDPEDVEAARVRWTIAAASLETHWELRDRHLRSDAFLDVEAHPEIVFESREVALTSAETAEITGDLTIRGVTREETFDVELIRFARSPIPPNPRIAGFRVTGVIDRTDYGVSFGAPAIGAEVAIHLEFEASPAADLGG